MKIAITAQACSVESQMSDVFGRCPCFVLAEIENGEVKSTEFRQNTNAGQRGGAGIDAAQAIAEVKAESVITGNIGPRAAEILAQFDIKVYFAEGTVQHAIEEFIKGNLEEIAP